MRLGEIITLISLTLSTIIVFIPHRDKPFFYAIFPFTLPIIIFLHLVIESPRWQMIPAYLISAILLLVTIIRIGKRKKEVKIFFHNKKKHPPLIIMVLISIIFPVVILLPVLLPVFSLPPPTGPYMVGTTEYTIYDNSRPEILTHDPDDYRKLVVKIWYPADTVDNKKRERYWQNPALLSTYLAKEYDVPSFFFEYLGLVKTHSFIDAEISDVKDTYPAILSLHGGKCTDSLNNLQMINEDLASNGYIVIGLTHPYSSLPIVFSDGKKASCSQLRKETLNLQSELSDTLRATYFTQQSKDKEELLQNIIEIETAKRAEIEIRIEDIRTVLNWLEDMKNDKMTTPFNKKWDPDKLSIIGFHLGGSVALNSFLRDQRIKTCVNLDGFHYVNNENLKIKKPYLLLTSEESGLHTIPFIINQLDTLSYLFTLKGTTEQSFTDYSLFSPLIDLFHHNGTLNNPKVVEITRYYINSFFSTYLLGEKTAAFITNPHEYEDLVVQGNNN
ncbi:MAG: hypothetical protein JXJ04_00635 [Spirochaetales bacterium]|nr:hypothetical protein [Spirochaetales bacterium]